MIILFPLGGTGERFRAAGYETPKPLIKVGDKRLFERVLDCYPLKLAKDVSYDFVVRPEISDAIWSISHDKLSPYFMRSCVHVLNRDTRGPVDTILSAPSMRSLLDSRRELLIADCDSLIATTELEDALRIFRSQGAVGGVTVRRTKDPACSYAMLDKDNFVTETAEKRVISEWSTTGPYWWREARDFLRCALIMAAKGEYHISPCYNQLISEHAKVKAFRTLTFKHLGTPDALEAYAEDMNLGVCK